MNRNNLPNSPILRIKISRRFKTKINANRNNENAFIKNTNNERNQNAPNQADEEEEKQFGEKKDQFLKSLQINFCFFQKVDYPQLLFEYVVNPEHGKQY